MADLKISELTNLTAADPANDMIPIVDVSATPPASGSTKRISINNILACSPTATLASATITGDLTVRTNQLIANANGVGVGTAPSAWSGIGPALQVEQASLLSESSNQLYLTANGYFAGGQWNYINNASADQYYQIAGSHVWRSGIGGAGGTAIGWSTLMTLNSTGLGVGVTPSASGGCLQLKSGITFPATQVASSDANTLDDYEEGTFTPAITGSTTAGTATYVGRNGKYTKIGNQVHVQIFIDYNSHTGTGDTRITGLPFTNGANFSGAVVGYANAITISAGHYLAAYVDGGQSYILLNQIPTGGGTNQTVPIDAAGTLVVSATYTV